MFPQKNRKCEVNTYGQSTSESTTCQQEQNISLPAKKASPFLTGDERMFKVIFESIKKMSIKLFSDITLTFTLLSIPKTYNINVVSPEEALKVVEAVNGQENQRHDETRICTTKDTSITNLPVE
jgi:hypothetical protein